jgi:hypothetical protein
MQNDFLLPTSSLCVKMGMGCLPQVRAPPAARRRRRPPPRRCHLPFAASYAAQTASYCSPPLCLATAITIYLLFLFLSSIPFSTVRHRATPRPSVPRPLSPETPPSPPHTGRRRRGQSPHRAGPRDLGGARASRLGSGRRGAPPPALPERGRGLLREYRGAQKLCMMGGLPARGARLLFSLFFFFPFSLSHLELN